MTCLFWQSSKVCAFTCTLYTRDNSAISRQDHPYNKLLANPYEQSTNQDSLYCRNGYQFRKYWYFTVSTALPKDGTAIKENVVHASAPHAPYASTLVQSTWHRALVLKLMYSIRHVCVDMYVMSLL